MLNPSLNHYAIAVKDLAKSINFYKEILGFQLCPRPNFEFKGAWFDIGRGIQLHLIEDTSTTIQFSGSRALHFAFEVADIQAAKTFLLNSGIKISKDIQLRPDGIPQIFIEDPDGYFVEITQLNNCPL